VTTVLPTTRTTGCPPPAFTIGQRVTVYAERGTWLDGAIGTVVALPRRGGLFTDQQIAVEIGGDSPIGSYPCRWLDPRRVAPLSICETCEHGCECDGAAGDTGCGRYGCWGRADGQTAPRCPGADVMRNRSAAAAFAYRVTTR